jgi:FtsP/CotA-like multicopper oxidase with cupredoxin domain
MAISLSNFLLPLSLLLSAAHSATVTYDFDIGWTYANPDGQYNRPVIGINGQWPIPPIVATKGDQVIVNVKNSLGNESASLHFHGLYMNGTTHMDGPVDVNQCGILPGSNFTYNFTVDQPGMNPSESNYVVGILLKEKRRHILVSQPRAWSVSRWPSRSPHCQRPGKPLQGPI